MRALFLTLFPVFLGLSSLHAQSTGDYRSAQSGNWNTASTWERFNGTGWVVAVATPTSADGTITIESGHTVTIPGGFSVSVDQLTVIQQLVIAFGGQLTLSNGSGTDLTAATATSLVEVSGIFIMGNGAVVDDQSTASRILFLSGSEYRHSYTTAFGELPIATWDANSTINIVGYTNTTTLTGNTSWSQSVGNVIFNAPGQRALVDFAGTFTNIQGSFSLLSTGNNAVQLSSGQSPSITIGGDLNIAGTSRLTVCTTDNSTTLTINGNWNYTSTNSTGTYLTNTGNCTVNLMGNFVFNGSGGRLHMSNTGSTGVSTINFNGDFSLLNGRIDENGSDPSQGNLRFVRNGTQNFINNGSIVGYINYFIASTSTVDASIYPFIGSPSAFRLDGTLVVGSTDVLGAIQNSTSRGNIRTPISTRVYSNGSTIVYRGSGQQYIGTGQPTTAGVTTVIDNSAGVLLLSNLTLNGLLRLESGFFNLSSFTFTSSANVAYNTGVFQGTSLSRLTITGTAGGSWGELRFDGAANSLLALTMNRTGAGAQADVTTPIVISSQLNLTRGILNNTGGLELLAGATITRYETSSVTGSRPTISSSSYNLLYRTFSESYATGLELPDPADETSLGNLIVNTASTAHTVSLTQNISVNGNMGLSNGTFSLSNYVVTMRGDQWSDNVGNLSVGTSLVIFDDSTIVRGASTPTFANIQVNPSKKLVFDRSVTFSGNLTFGAGSSLDAGKYSATLTGSALQTISGNGVTFYDILITKSGGADVELLSNTNVAGSILFSSPSSNVNFMSNGFLTLVSTSDAAGSGTGSIYRLQSGNTVSGNVTVQRFMSGEGKIYRYLSTPVSGAFVSQWKDDFLITGPFLDPSPRTRICGVFADPSQTSLYYYDQSVPGDIDTGWVAYPAPGFATTNSPIVVGRGYGAYIRQCTEPTVVDVTGPVNQGTITFPVTYTNTASSGDGWNLVGNPYPATIDWDGSGAWTKVNISPVISITDNGTGMIRYYDPGVTNDIPNGQIASGQAFWIRATAPNPILRSIESAKVTTQAEFYREASPLSIPSFSINLSNGVLEDIAYVKVLDSAVARLDKFDGPKIANPTFNLSTLSEEGIEMAINALDQLICSATLKISAKGLEAGQYVMSFAEREQFFNEHQFILVDRFLQKEVNLKKVGQYGFEVTGEAASRSFDRFSLRIESSLPVLEIASSTPVVACSEASSFVALKSSSSGAAYSLWNEGKQLAEEVIGTGDALIIYYSSDSLKEGNNVLKVAAQNGCSSQTEVTETIAVARYVPKILSVTSTALSNGSAKLTAMGNIALGIVSWYEQKIGGEPIYVGTEFETSILAESKMYYVSITYGSCSSDRLGVLATGLENASESLTGVRVYPNPVKTALAVEILHDDVEKIDFVNTLGQPLSSIDVQGARGAYSMDFKGLSQGVYLMIVTKKAGKKTIRLLKE